MPQITMNLSKYMKSKTVCVTSNVIVFEERPHHHNTDGDAASPNSELPTPSSISSPTEPTKSTNLEETGSSNHTQDSTELGTRSRSTMDVDVPDTRQAPLAAEEPDVEVKPLTGKTENLTRNV